MGTITVYWSKFKEGNMTEERKSIQLGKEAHKVIKKIAWEKEKSMRELVEEKFMKHRSERGK